MTEYGPRSSLRKMARVGIYELESIEQLHAIVRIIADGKPVTVARAKSKDAMRLGVVS